MKGVYLYFLIQTLIRVQKVTLFMDKKEYKSVEKKILSKNSLRLHSEFTILNYILNLGSIIIIRKKQKSVKKKNDPNLSKNNNRKS